MYNFQVKISLNTLIKTQINLKENISKGLIENNQLGKIILTENQFNTRTKRVSQRMILNGLL